MDKTQKECVNQNQVRIKEQNKQTKTTIRSEIYTELCCELGCACVTRFWDMCVSLYLCRLKGIPRLFTIVKDVVRGEKQKTLYTLKILPCHSVKKDHGHKNISEIGYCVV